VAQDTGTPHLGRGSPPFQVYAKSGYYAPLGIDRAIWSSRQLQEMRYSAGRQTGVCFAVTLASGYCTPLASSQACRLVHVSGIPTAISQPIKQRLKRPSSCIESNEAFLRPELCSKSHMPR
jgi:hypothetical protein